MDGSLAWLALEVKYLAATREFYGETIGLDPVEEREDEVVFAAGQTDLVCRRPSSVPRGGLHTHFAFSAPESYEAFRGRLDSEFDLVEHTFGDARSMYCYDPDGNCVEIGEADPPGPGITGIFEVVLEVADLEAAVDFYQDLGFEPNDTGTDRRRVRLEGPFDLELWEPQLGIADARGGVHVDLGMTVPDPAATLSAVEGRYCQVEDVEDGVRFLDPDCHWITLLSSDGG